LINFRQFFNFVVNAKNHENCKTQLYLLPFIKVGNVLAYLYTMQSVNTHFRLSANHADKQVMSHFRAKEQKC